LFRSINQLESQYTGLFGKPGDNQEPSTGDEWEEFRKYWGFYSSINEITMGQPWLEDEIGQWPVTRFLNRLAFMKDQNETAKRVKIKESLNGRTG
jgi:hypothetical protein